MILETNDSFKFALVIVNIVGLNAVNEVIFLGKISLSSLNEGKEMILMMIMVEGVWWRSES